jgi:DNA-binding MarR family transcriptional regulator
VFTTRIISGMSIRHRVQQTHFTSAISEAWVSLVVAADHLTQQSAGVYKRHGLTSDRYNVLRILRGARPGGFARGEITRRLMRRSPDTTRMLDRLQRDGLIERSPGTDDARLSVARISQRGLAMLELIDPEIEDVMAAAAAPLSQGQLRQLAQLCNALVP